MTIYDTDVRTQVISGLLLPSLENSVNQWLDVNTDRWIREINYTTSVKPNGSIMFSMMIVYDESPGGVG